MIMVQLRGLYLRRKMLTENFDSFDEHCFYIKLHTAISYQVVLYTLVIIQPLLVVVTCDNLVLIFWLL